MTAPTATKPAADVAILDAIQRRVLWLATAIVHHANRVRPNPSGIKVGGHQASSASMVSLMTALWFAHLERHDRVSVKPHASPVLHAINYLLGRLDAAYLERLREYGGLQSYPSRTKDPDPVDYSTGSVGIGATAPIWGALAQRYVAGHFPVQPAGRQIGLLGDAELDEGAVWEAVADPMVARLGEVLWVVDLNRQSLDRVVPDIAADRLAAMFGAAGWHVEMVKYGKLLTELFERDGGDALRVRIDRMANGEFQRLLRARGPELRERLPAGDTALQRLVRELDDRQLHAAVRDLGGHDLPALLQGFRSADSVRDRPSVLFAYTIKGWSLPVEGHPANHSALLTVSEYEQLARTLGADSRDPWAPFASGSEEAALCAAVAERLQRPPVERHEPPSVPPELGRRHTGTASTQQALGRLFVELASECPAVAEHVVTVSPDVASSTNLGGWINKAGIWDGFAALAPGCDRVDWFADDTDMLVRWRESARGRHMELGIAEVNLVGLLGELGATWSRDGRPLLPVGTIYDSFVTRAHEPWSFGIYAGGQSILVGTPSGVTLGPEGGAHQSVVTPSIGVEQPGCLAYEPAFTQDFEWCFLHALGRLGRPDGTAAYFRLSTRPVDQALARVPQNATARELRRLDAVAGAYVLRVAPRSTVTIAVAGALVVEALKAAEILDAEVVCVTSADLVFRALQARQGLRPGPFGVLSRAFGAARPLIGVIDGHPHSLGFLSAINGVPMTCLGVTEYGQSGDIADLYPHHGVDAETIVGAALDLI